MRTLDTTLMSPLELQNYLQYAIGPRPIALVSTIDMEGNVNLSPFSFFNLFSVNPPVCAFSPSRRVRDNSTKHTLENIKQVPECVINIVTCGMVMQTSLTSSDYAKGVNEFDKAGFTQLKSELVRPPGVAESPVQLECAVIGFIPLGDGPGAGNLVLAEIKRMHISEDILDSDGRIDQQKLDLVARLGGDWYAAIGPENLFKIPKPITTIGMGVDSLPEYVRASTVLTGNDLGQLANVTEVPDEKAVTAFVIAETAVLRMLHNMNSHAGQLYVHQQAKAHLAKGQVTVAWLMLLAGEQYEKQQLNTH
ncbi:MAG: flavin reductase family protein [Sphingobacteriales bacterium]|nr:MAG: flavin reductase family protein [Sphingobacteriales bacterium]